MKYTGRVGKRNKYGEWEEELVDFGELHCLIVPGHEGRARTLVDLGVMQTSIKVMYCSEWFVATNGANNQRDTVQFAPTADNSRKEVYQVYKVLEWAEDLFEVHIVMFLGKFSPDYGFFRPHEIRETGWA
ncbi:MAG: hypothetical protein OXF23_01545 [Candidatus Dadabacteria bacterium]|nr:hypothetical protein [Candidatus Dadabacteria bacterium]